MQEHKLDTELFELKFGKSYRKILRIEAAAEDSFVMLVMNGNGNETLVHSNSQGKTLHEIHFKHPVDSFILPNSHEAVVLETRNNCISVLDLKTHQRREIPHQFMYEESDQSNLLAFGQTSMICVVEQGRYNDSRFKLTYYSSLASTAKPTNVFESDHDWNYQYIIKQANSHSLVAWFKPRQDIQFQLKTYCPEKGVVIHTSSNKLGQKYGSQDPVQYAICTLREMNPGIFWLIGISNKENLRTKTVKQSQEAINNNLVWETTSGLIRESNFLFDPKYSDFLVDVDFVGEMGFFPTFRFENGESLVSPIYWVNNKEQIVGESSWQCSYLSKFSPCAYKKQLLESKYENADVSYVSIRRLSWN